MERGTTSRGMKNCRNFAILARFFNTMLVKMTALVGNYCPLTHYRNGLPDFVDCSLVTQ
jgi:hypothetical protein